MEEADLTPLTVKQVAQRLACSVRTVYRLVELKRLAKPRYHSPREPRWFPEDVRTYLHRLLCGEFDGENDEEAPKKRGRDD